MTHSIAYAIKKVLVDMAANDKLPLDMNELDPDVFSDAIKTNRSYGGISKEDVQSALEERGYEDEPDDKIFEILDEYEDTLMFDGSGLHGAELIDYVLDEAGYNG